VYVACSTLCFGRRSFPDALQSISEMGFTKIDVVLSEGGHISPSEVAADLSRVVQMLKAWPGIAPAAFHVEFAPDIAPAAMDHQLRAICRLGRVLAVSLVSIPAASMDSDYETEVSRLTRLVRLCEAEGITCAIDTRIDTFTESPDRTIDLCRRVPGLGVSLDPSHYVVGPYHTQDFDALYPFVKHVRLRDSGKNMEKFQVRVGQGEIEYGKIVNQLTRWRYNRTLSVDIRDNPDSDFPMQPEVRKLKYLLESLI
jgi:sugar phosphate isomerase/epimerase